LSALALSEIGDAPCGYSFMPFFQAFKRKTLAFGLFSNCYLETIAVSVEEFPNSGLFVWWRWRESNQRPVEVNIPLVNQLDGLYYEKVRQ
jgi:hypothetical protein